MGGGGGVQSGLRYSSRDRVDYSRDQLSIITGFVCVCVTQCNQLLMLNVLLGRVETRHFSVL